MKKKDETNISHEISFQSMKGIRVLITGGLGFIGSNLACRCVELGAEVEIFDCLDPQAGGNLFNINDIKDSVTVSKLDILDFDKLAEHIVDKDIIFNCAAMTSHSFSMREPWLDQDVNCRGMINLLEAMRQFNPEAKLVHVGTSTQLGRLHYTPADEDHPEFPTDIYSANKSVGEKYVLIFCWAYNLKATVVRLSNVFGPRASIHSPEFTFNNYFMGLALQDRDITVFGDGKQLRNVVFVDDAVSALIMASLSDEVVGEVLFCVGDRHYSVAEIAENTVKHIGGGRVDYVPWPAGRESVDVGDAVISNDKIKRILNWTPDVDLETGLVISRDYFRSCLKEYLR